MSRAKRKRSREHPESGGEAAIETGSQSPPIRMIGGHYEIQGRWPIVALALLTYLMTLPMFAPLAFWPIAYVAFVPWLAGACAGKRTRWVYLASYLLGVVFFLTHWRWLWFATGAGYVAGSLYCGLFFPLAVWPVRHLYRKRSLSVAITFAVVWTGVELLRSRGALEFPWFLLGHSQIRLLTLIQIADLTGVYGVSFVVAMVNGWFVDLFLRPILIWHGSKAWPPRVGPVGTLAVVVCLGTTIIYGRFRLSAKSGVEGPSVAVIQGDFLLSPEPDSDSDAEKLKKKRSYFASMDKAAGEEPDMVVLPETPWSMWLNREVREIAPDGYWTGRASNEFAAWAEQKRAYVVVGSLSVEPKEDEIAPDSRRYNSAFVYTPGISEPERYDKIHLVIFGEYIPFRDSDLLHPLYLWLNGITPWGADGTEYSLRPGKLYKTFTMQERRPGGNAYRFGVTICYEDAIAYGFRKFVVDRQGNKRVDFMLNISNDGWFGRGPQQPQHLVACAFRAVENRVGIARAVNTGVSGFINPDGSWRDLVAESESSPRAGGEGWRVSRVVVDPRVTFYSVHGDVFGLGCVILMLVSLADAMLSGVDGWRKSREDRRQRVSA